MSLTVRRTIARPVDLSGIGLHTGATVHLTIVPAQVNAGIVFVRTDLPSSPRISTTATVHNTDRHTTLGTDEATVETVEHLLASAYALGIDDLAIHIDGPELPIFDGSADPYYQALAQVGTLSQAGPKPGRRLTEPFTVQFNGATYVARPGRGATVLEVQIEFDHPAIGRQHFHYDGRADTFATDLAGARTFGFTSELSSLRSRGLIRGATAGSAILLDERGIAHGGPLRWPDEFVRHKTVDLIGDLALLGASFEGEINAINPGHGANARLVTELRTRCT